MSENSIARLDIIAAINLNPNGLNPGLQLSHSCNHDSEAHIRKLPKMPQTASAIVAKLLEVDSAFAN